MSWTDVDRHVIWFVAVFVVAAITNGLLAIGFLGLLESIPLDD